ncbi:MAG TPA: hypothetical protein VGR08_05710 [Thermomicrobiales bacterium]|nr:hypothetical protein [Thermomicrobiales bacterium]
MSTKTVADKLMIKPGTAVWISPAEHRSRIGPLPEGSSIVEDIGDATIGLLFAQGAAAARELLTANRDHLTAPSILWVAYQKGNKADINRDSLWPILVEFGMRPNGQVAVDDIWSALRFRASKEGEAPFTGGRS